MIDGVTVTLIGGIDAEYMHCKSEWSIVCHIGRLHVGLLLDYRLRICELGAFQHAKADSTCSNGYTITDGESNRHSGADVYSGSRF